MLFRSAIERIRKELLPMYPNVDDVVAVTHEYGCGVAIVADDASIPINAIKNIAKNPNFGDVIYLGLGCEKLRPEMLCDELSDHNLIMLQEQNGFESSITAIFELAHKKLIHLNNRKRTTHPISKLMVGMQCGGSDAFSGITANPPIGYASDMIVKLGGTVLFS